MKRASKSSALVLFVGVILTIDESIQFEVNMIRCGSIWYDKVISVQSIFS